MSIFTKFVSFLYAPDARVHPSALKVCFAPKDVVAIFVLFKVSIDQHFEKYENRSGTSKRISNSVLLETTVRRANIRESHVGGATVDHVTHGANDVIGSGDVGRQVVA